MWQKFDVIKHLSTNMLRSIQLANNGGVSFGGSCPDQGLSRPLIEVCWGIAQVVGGQCSLPLARLVTGLCDKATRIDPGAVLKPALVGGRI